MLPLIGTSAGSLALTGIILQFVLKLVCFVLGFLTIRLGYDLIKAGVKGEFTFKGELGGASADLRSVSPGLLFVLLGVVLIGYGMWVPKETRYTEPSSARRRNVVDPPLPTDDEFEALLEATE